MQVKISQVEARADISQRKAVDLLKSMVDYYQRIAGTPNSMLNAQTVLNLVNPLILPLIRLLASNHEWILRILGVQR